MPPLDLNELTDEIDGLVQDCNISIANALEILQSCIELLKSSYLTMYWSLVYLECCW